MGIFSLFGKKDRQPAPAPADRASSSKKREEQRPARPERNTELEMAQTIQRKAARATALKIDAIEHEMSTEFVKTAPPENTIAAPNTKPLPPAAAPANKNGKQNTDSWAPVTFQPTASPMGSTTDFLLGGELPRGAVAMSESVAAPVIEEAAILFANNQVSMVEHILRAAIDDNTLGHAALIVWQMLFDLYQINNDQEQFEQLSIEYANKFETSPPAWLSNAYANGQAASNVSPSGVTPSLQLTGPLDDSIKKQLDRLMTMAEKSQVLRLEFTRLTDLAPSGCALLLAALKSVQKLNRDLILVGAPELTDNIRAMLEVGRRDEIDAPWLLLLEVLQLLNREQDFEEASIDYCVTFEVSPPAFVAPKNKISTALEDLATFKVPSDEVTIPSVIDGQVTQLVQQIAAYAGSHNPAIIDCSNLKRVDFGAAGQLLAGLTPVINNGARIELRNVNHLVSALFNVIGLKDVAAVLPRKG